MNDTVENYIMQWLSYPIRRFFNKETPKVNNANLIKYNSYLKNGQLYPSR